MFGFAMIYSSKAEDDGEGDCVAFGRNGATGGESDGGVARQGERRGEVAREGQRVGCVVSHTRAAVCRSNRAREGRGRNNRSSNLSKVAAVPRNDGLLTRHQSYARRRASAHNLYRLTR